jgi:hypothetical protein
VNYELLSFKKGRSAPSILISPGSGGHSYVFADLGYRMQLKGYNVFIMPKHGGRTISELIPRHIDALKQISASFNNQIGVYGEGRGGYVTFYLALATPVVRQANSGSFPLKSIVCQSSPAITTERSYQQAIMGAVAPRCEGEYWFPSWASFLNGCPT